MDFDLKKLSKLISEKLGKHTEIISSDEVGRGYHSTGYKLMTADGRAFFLKHLKSNDLGFEFPERKIMSLGVSQGMAERAGNHAAPLGVIVVTDDEETVLPKIDKTTKVFHLQEYAGEGTSYSNILYNNAHKKTVDDEDRSYLEAIADELVKIHSIKHHSDDVGILKAVYDDGLRAILINPELSIRLLSTFPSGFKILDLEGQKEMISLMYENMKSWMGRYDRMTALHGDFWGSNIFFRDDKSIFIIDFSRIPWGDPGIDAGWFMSEFIWKYYETGNMYYQELANEWLRIYEKKSGDKEIRKAVTLAVGWSGIVQICPRIFPDIDVAKAKKFIEHVMEILRKKEFFWEE